MVSFFHFFLIVWPLYTALTWWLLLDPRTWDAYLARLAHLGVIMGSAGIITLLTLDGWHYLKTYSFV